MHKIAVVLAIAAVGEGLLALHLVKQLHQERESAQALQARVTELERRAPQPTAGAAFVAVPTQSAAAPFTVINAGARAPSQEQAQQPAGPTEPDADEMRKQMIASFERQHALLRDPEYREAMVAQQKIMLMRMNPDIARDLELSPEQMDRLYTTLGEQFVRRMESQEYLGDLATDPQGMQAKMEEANRKSAELQRVEIAEVRKVLGDAKFREYEAYVTMAGPRSEASRIRESLATAGVPLDDTLALPLAKALNEHQQKAARAAPMRPEASFVSPHGLANEQVRLNTVENQREQLESIETYQRQQREALARILSPQQLKVIEEEQESSLQLQRAQLRVMQAQPPDSD
ncbi:MAG TPA: hypothetical protein VJS12_19400 [Steroidobacteraceae bacterium]|nr:hypothetical protein [Steroidobacteraceae bacterium]